MLEESLDPRPAPPPLDRWIGPYAAALQALHRDPSALARNWNDRESVWGNLRDIRHWIELARQ